MTSTDFYKKSPKARARKRAYDRKYNATKSATDKRVELNRINRRNGVYGNGDGKDYSHTIRGYESASRNRGRREKSRLKGSKRS